MHKWFELRFFWLDVFHHDKSIGVDTDFGTTLQKARTQDSAKAFMEGLCGGTHTYTDQAGAAGITGHDRHVQISSQGFHGTYTIHAKPKDDDPVLRFFDMCPAYDDYVATVDAEFLVRNTAESLHSCKHRNLSPLIFTTLILWMQRHA